MGKQKFIVFIMLSVGYVNIRVFSQEDALRPRLRRAFAMYNPGPLRWQQEEIRIQLDDRRAALQRALAQELAQIAPNPNRLQDLQEQIRAVSEQLNNIERAIRAGH